MLALWYIWLGYKEYQAIFFRHFGKEYEAAGTTLLRNYYKVAEYVGIEPPEGWPHGKTTSHSAISSDEKEVAKPTLPEPPKHPEPPPGAKETIKPTLPEPPRRTSPVPTPSKPLSPPVEPPKSPSPSPAPKPVTPESKPTPAVQPKSPSPPTQKPTSPPSSGPVTPPPPVHPFPPSPSSLPQPSSPSSPRPTPEFMKPKIPDPPRVPFDPTPSKNNGRATSNQFLEAERQGGPKMKTLRIPTPEPELSDEEDDEDIASIEGEETDEE